MSEIASYLEKEGSKWMEGIKTFLQFLIHILFPIYSHIIFLFKMQELALAENAAQ